MDLLDTFSSRPPLLDTFSSQHFEVDAIVAVESALDFAAAPIVAAEVAAKPRRIRRTKQRIEADRFIKEQKAQQEAERAKVETLKQKRSRAGKIGQVKKRVRCKAKAAKKRKEEARRKDATKQGNFDQVGFLDVANFQTKKRRSPIAESTSCTAIVPYNAFAAERYDLRNIYGCPAVMKIFLEPILVKLIKADLLVENR